MDRSDAKVSSQQGKSLVTNQAILALRQAPQRIPCTTSMGDIRLLFRRIEACLRNGIRLTEVVDVLADEHNIVISASTLQSSMSRIRKEKGLDCKSVKSRANFGASLVRERPIRKAAD